MRFTALVTISMLLLLSSAVTATDLSMEMNPVLLQKKIPNQKAADKIYNSKTKNVKKLFRAGAFYIYHVFGVLKKESISEKNEKAYASKAVDCFQRAYELEPRNSYILAWLG